MRVARSWTCCSFQRVAVRPRLISALPHLRWCCVVCVIPGATGLVGAGVNVMMRYTLRLFALDQLARATGLVCALELERT